jgi:hypothetical protein
LTLVEPTVLTQIAAAADAEEGLYIEGLTNYIDSDIISLDPDIETSLNKISIKGGKLGY